MMVETGTPPLPPGGPTAGHVHGDRLWRQWQGTGGSVALPDDPALIRALAQTQTGWPWTETSETAHRLAQVWRGRRGSYALRSTHLDAPLTGLGLAGTVCAINADLIESWLARHPDHSGLHCGAVALGDRLIALTGAAGSGKSTLIAALATLPEARIFCDDILPVTPDGVGIALGITPRLRLPLPDVAPKALRDLLARHPGPADQDYAYFRPRHQAGFGDTAPLIAIVALDRQASGPARLEWLDPGDMARLLLQQNVARNRDTAQALARMSGLIEGRECLRLVYADLAQAVALLQRAFGKAFLPPDLRIEPARPMIPAASQIAEPAPAASIIWARATGVFLQMHGNAGFLSRADDPTVWTLDRLALAVWLMLDKPGSARDLAQPLAELYPSVPPDQLTRDIAVLLAGLAAEGLVIRT